MSHFPAKPMGTEASEAIIQWNMGPRSALIYVNTVSKGGKRHLPSFVDGMNYFTKWLILLFAFVLSFERLVAAIKWLCNND